MAGDIYDELLFKQCSCSRNYVFKAQDFIIVHLKRKQNLQILRAGLRDVDFLDYGRDLKKLWNWEMIKSIICSVKPGQTPIQKVFRMM